MPFDVGQKPVLQYVAIVSSKKGMCGKGEKISIIILYKMVS